MPTRAALLFAAAAGLGAAGLSTLAAYGGAGLLERQAVAHLSAALLDEDDWVSLRADGTRITVEGAAPSAGARRVALARLGAARDGLTVIDATSVGGAAVEAPAVPEIGVVAAALTILVGPDGITLMGDVPEDDLALTLGVDRDLVDLRVGHSGTAPPRWADSLARGLDAAAAVDTGKILIEPGSVAITGTVASAEALAATEAALTADPNGLDLTVALTAPRPVIAPFAFKARLADGAVNVATCTADSDAVAEAIAARLTALGAEAPTCAVGLGAPSPEWGAAVLAAIDSLDRLAEGQVDIADADVTLTGPPGMPQAAFDREMAALSARMPAVFSLSATLPPPPPDPTVPATVQPPRFSAVRTEDGAVRFRGDLTDAQLQDTARAFAEAQFGFDTVVDETAVREDLPSAWGSRVVAGLEALGRLQAGQVEVTEGLIEITGTSTSDTVELEVRAALDARLPAGTDTRLEVWTTEALRVDDDGPAIPPELCAEQIDVILTAGQIVFPPSTSEISEGSLPILDRIAEVLLTCPGGRFEIEGHTDSQGRESSNMALSQARADAVLRALLERGLDTVFLYAKGYGESRPIASNEDEAGRARNRRIAFRLMPGAVPEPTLASAPEGEAATLSSRGAEGPTVIVETTDTPPEAEEPAVAALPDAGAEAEGAEPPEVAPAGAAAGPDAPAVDAAEPDATAEPEVTETGTAAEDRAVSDAPVTEAEADVEATEVETEIEAAGPRPKPRPRRLPQIGVE